MSCTIRYTRVLTPDLTSHPRDDWNFVCVQAQADIAVSRHGSTTHYTLRSPGLYGVESDADEAYLNEAFENERAVLAADIASMSEPEPRLSGEAQVILDIHSNEPLPPRVGFWAWIRQGLRDLC